MSRKTYGRWPRALPYAFAALSGLGFALAVTGARQFFVAYVIAYATVIALWVIAVKRAG